MIVVAKKHDKRTAAETIQRLRCLRDWTQADLARELGTSRERVRLLELPTSDPKLSTLRRVAAVFGVSVAQLIGDEPI